VDVSGLRQRLSLAQEHFAACFGFSVARLRHRERGDREPSGTTRRFPAKLMDKKIEGQTRLKPATQSHRTKGLPT